MDDFQQTLSKYEVAQQEQEELKAIVESTKEAIVVRPFQEGPAATSNQQHRIRSNFIVVALPALLG